MARGTRELESTDYLPNLDAGEQPVSYRNLKITLVSQQVTPVSEREFKTQAENEAFMQEEIVIRLHPTSDKNAPPVVPVGCNGEQVWLPRGRPISIPRKFIESLARYETSFTSVRTQDPNADEGFVNKASAAQPYPFSVIRDENPKGRAWLERIMRGG
jgi:hypothetical protein